MDQPPQSADRGVVYSDIEWPNIVGTKRLYLQVVYVNVTCAFFSFGIFNSFYHLPQFSFSLDAILMKSWFFSSIVLQLCEGSYSKGYCPGICQALHDCGSCVVQGSGAQMHGSSLVGLTHNQQCSWCAKEGKCQPLEGECIILTGNHKKLNCLAPRRCNSNFKTHVVD